MRENERLTVWNDGFDVFYSIFTHSDGSTAMIRRTLNNIE